MLYNIHYEAAAICFLFILNIYIRLQYSTKSKQNRLFQKLALNLLMTVTLDVITAAAISYGSYIPIGLNMVLNFIYCMSLCLLEYHFLQYCLIGICRREPKGAFFQICRGITAAVFLLLVLNFFTGWVFYFTPEGEYSHGPLYYVVFASGLFYILAAAAVILYCESTRLSTNQKISVIIYCISSLAGPVIQIFFPHLLFALFTVSLGFLTLMFSMETPDYQKLARTMEELSHTRDEAEEAMGLAQAANQAKTDFLSSMSHELRTPINSILGFNEMIMQETDDPDIIKCTENVQSAGMSLLSIISNILDFTEMDSGRLKISDEPYSVRSMFRDVIAYAEYGTERSQVELRTDISENIPSGLSGDITRITQIFNNIISNAVKYTYKGYVEIKAEWRYEGDDEGILSAKITDTGIGIKKEDLERLSENFKRFDKKRNQNIQGVGLGLSIVTRLLSLMDGNMSVESKYEQGTAVSFELRQRVTDRTPIGRISSSLSASESNDSSYKFIIPEARILTVDDNKMNRELFKGLLRDSGAMIDDACGGKEAISLLKKNTYDIIFLDHMMPYMDGIETLSAIKRAGIDGGAPVIVLTANTVAGARESYLAEGFQDYLAKPVTARMLYGMLKKYLPSDLIKPIAAEETQMEEKKTEKKKRSVTERLGMFLDTAVGMTYCCDDEEFYLSMLETYLENSRLDDMKKFFGEKDFDNYRITVHSIKSTSLTIGASELSEEAKALEFAQKEGNIRYIEENHQRVYEHYSDVLGKIKAVLDDPDDLLGSDTQTDSAIRLLAVDDDPSCLAIIKKVLGEGFDVVTAESGAEALRIFDRTAPDAVLTDIYMPGMDGFELMKKIKERSRIPVVFLTADPDKSLEERCFAEGAADFITKPVTNTILMNRLNRVIELEKIKI